MHMGVGKGMAVVRDKKCRPRVSFVKVLTAIEACNNWTSCARIGGTETRWLAASLWDLAQMSANGPCTEAGRGGNELGHTL